jgi:hypothetical protein
MCGNVAGENSRPTSAENQTIVAADQIGRSVVRILVEPVLGEGSIR